MITEILKRPILSEKLITKGEYAFEVDLKANKPQIAKAIQQVFKVDPVSIRTVIVKGRSKRTYKSRKEVSVKDWKKAVIRLKKDQKIEIFENTTK